jgi:N-acetylglucosamine-6-phosphate deacetylase
MTEDIMTLKGHIVREYDILEGFITIRNGIITEINNQRPSGPVIDFSNMYVAPGFIDLHIHGLHRSLLDNGPSDLSEICRALPQYGVTGFLPTVAPRPQGEDATFLETLSRTETKGAEILGFHLEGPFLKITGALPEGAISATDINRLRSLINAAKPLKAVFSISPDKEGVEALIPVMAAGGTPVFITHTAATVEQTQVAIELGARHATHFYDVFPFPPVKEPGVRPCGAVEAILADKRVSVDFILDGIHVDPVAVKMAIVCKSEGPGRVCLITDSNVGAGLEPGRFVFGNSGEIEFAYKGAPARLTKDNTLAGSGLTLNKALQNAVKWLDISLSEALKMVSTNPAQVIGVDNRKGKLQAGYDADFVLLDEQLNVVQTWISGKQYF